MKILIQINGGEWTNEINDTYDIVLVKDNKHLTDRLTQKSFD